VAQSLQQADERRAGERDVIMIRVKPSVRPTETYTESNFLRLHTYPAAGGADGRRVTLEHLCYSAKAAVGATVTRSSQGWKCETIVDGEIMSREDALFIAKSYAAENNIPVIYECHSE
jgi:hypothetical protein